MLKDSTTLYQFIYSMKHILYLDDQYWVFVLIQEFILQVQLSNKGPIDAPFRWSSPDTTFGRCFSFNPEEGVVPSGACQIVEVSFCSPILGSFFEELLLSVAGQPQPLTFTVG